MASKRTTDNRGYKTKGADITRVDMVDDDEAASITTAGRERPDSPITQSSPVIGRTAWDVAHAAGVAGHADRVLGELDPVELMAVLLYAYLVWKAPDKAPSFVLFVALLAGYHLVLRPLLRIGAIALATVVGRMYGGPSR